MTFDDIEKSKQIIDTQLQDMTASELKNNYHKLPGSHVLSKKIQILIYIVFQ